MTKPKPEHDYPITRGQVVFFAMCEFREPRHYASKRVRRSSWGYRIDTQPLAFILTKDYDLMTFGNGPILVNGFTGLCTQLSSNPDDTFGIAGLTSLHTPDDLVTLEAYRGWQVGNIGPDSV
jgi:hypothetical protein